MTEWKASANPPSCREKVQAGPTDPVSLPSPLPGVCRRCCGRWICHWYRIWNTGTSCCPLRYWLSIASSRPRCPTTAAPASALVWPAVRRQWPAVLLPPPLPHARRSKQQLVAPDVRRLSRRAPLCGRRRKLESRLPRRGLWPPARPPHGPELACPSLGLTGVCLSLQQRGARTTR